MTDAETPAAPLEAPLTLTESVRRKVEAAQAPLKLAEVRKGLTKPRKQSAAEFEAEVRRSLDEDVRVGRVFVYPSGPKGAERYWARDEKHAIREQGLEVAEAPDTLANLAKQAKGVSGADAAFVESVLRDLIAEGRLFEHPPKGKGKAAKPLFGRVPPPPPPPPPHPLDVGKNKTAFGRLVEAARKLLGSAGVSADDLLGRMRSRLTGDTAAGPGRSRPTAAAEPGASPLTAKVGPLAAEPTADLEGLILTATGRTPVLSLAELRRQMPDRYRGPEFDAAVIRLFDEQQVVLYQDASPARYSDAERAELVRDEDGTLFTTISRRS